MSDHDQPIAANLLGREFDAARPDQRWVGATTEFINWEQRQGVPGGYSRSLLALHRRLGAQRVNDRHLALKALDMALKRRCPDVGLLHHSDQGCTYASEDYRTRLEQHGITGSMSRRGNCYDNAASRR